MSNAQCRSKGQNSHSEKSQQNVPFKCSTHLLKGTLELSLLLSDLSNLGHSLVLGSLLRRHEVLRQLELFALHRLNTQSQLLFLSSQLLRQALGMCLYLCKQSG